MSGYYDRNGVPITQDEWAEQAREGNRVAETHVGDAYVSTIWLGMDHAWGSARPLIFESMVFGGNLDQEQVRYSTQADALEGHAALVQKVRVEHDAFAGLCANEEFRTALAVVDSFIDAHRALFGIEEYGEPRTYMAAVRAVLQ